MINSQYREKTNTPRPLYQGGINSKTGKLCRSSNLSFSNKGSGFALIEVIVSMVILSIVLSAAVGLLYSVSTAVEANRDRLTATYLAQECLELVRNSRDTAWRNHHKWNCAWQNNSSCSESSIISSIKSDPVVINGKNTKFSRNFEIGEINSNENESEASSSIDFAAAAVRKEVPEEETEITCHISWKEGKLSISEILTNWRKI